MTVTFACKVPFIAIGPHYGSLISFAAEGGININGNDLLGAQVGGDGWHIVILAIDEEESKAKAYLNRIDNVVNIEIDKKKELDRKGMGIIYFGTHISAAFQNYYKRVNGEVWDVRVYDWCFTEEQTEYSLKLYETKMAKEGL